MKKIIATTALAAMTPFVASAQVTVTNLGDVLNLIQGFINTLLPLIIALAVLVFVWGVFKYVSAGDDEEARKSGRMMMVNGIIAIFVMVSVWGLVNILVYTFNLAPTVQAPPSTPTFIPLSYVV